MAFRFKDLMITMVGEGAGNPGGECVITCLLTGCAATTVPCEGGTCGLFSACTISCGLTPGCTHLTIPVHTCGCTATPTIAITQYTCGWRTCHFTHGCTGESMQITGTCTCSATGNPRAGGFTAEQLATLKSELQRAVVEIEDLEKKLNEGTQPKTVAEIEELERKLEAAMNELKKKKSELGKE